MCSLNIAATVGAFSLGHAQDRWGHQRTLAVTLVGWIITCVIVALAQTKPVFWGAAVLAGELLGGLSGYAPAGIRVLVAAGAGDDDLALFHLPDFLTFLDALFVLMRF